MMTLTDYMFILAKMTYDANKPDIDFMKIRLQKTDQNIIWLDNGLESVKYTIPKLKN